MGEGKRDGARDQEDADQPQFIEPAAVIGGGRLLVEVDPVAEGPDDQPGNDPEELASATEAADDEGAESKADQEDVAERIGEVRQHRGRISIRQSHQRRRKQGGGEGRCGKPADRPVEPAGGGEVADSPLDQERDPYVEERQGGEIASIGERRVRSPLDVGKREGPVEVGNSPRKQPEADRQPDGSLIAHERGAHQTSEAREKEGGVVDPDLRDVPELRRLPGGDEPGVGDRAPGGPGQQGPNQQPPSA